MLRSGLIAGARSGDRTRQALRPVEILAGGPPALYEPKFHLR
jgi:hypothetical protein